jgi:hypothetical protein
MNSDQAGLLEELDEESDKIQSESDEAFESDSNFFSGESQASYIRRA